jgi:hypothetical protein
MKKKTFLLIVLTFLVHGAIHGQSSLVPVYHQVYDWLHYQRVLGNAPLYNYESLPLTRGQITHILTKIEVDNISSSDNRTRHSYLREFSADSLENYKTFSVIQGDGTIISRFKKWTFSDDEPHIYAWKSSESNAVFDLSFNPSSTIVTDDSENVNSPFYFTSMLRGYGTYRKSVGFHIEQHGVSANSNNKTFKYLPFFGRNAKYLLNNDSMEHFEAYASLHNNDWSVAIGRGTLKNGVGKRNNLIYSREGIPFDWIRINIDTKYVDYTSVTGFLTWKPVRGEVQGYPGVFSKTSPSRYTIMHKIQFQPYHWITIGYYEMINYSNREFEIAYLNPVTRLSLMEFEQDDQDNGFAGLLGSLRPIKGLELYAELLVDDIGVTRDIIRINNHNRDGESLFAHHFGANYALKSGQVFNITYQRLDPNIYAHRYPFNAHSEAEIGLGSQLGPNADEWSFNFDQWFSLRSKLSLGFSINRHGLNYTNDEGEFVDVGGDINNSNFYDPITGKLSEALSTNFLKGDLHEWNTFYGQFIYEIWRGLTLKIDASYRKMNRGEQIKDLFITTVGIKIGE